MPRGDREALRDLVLAEKYASVDPAVDGWNSEVQNGLISARLHELGEIWGREQVGEHSLTTSSAFTELEKLCSKDFECSRLREVDATLVYEDEGIVVHSGASTPETSAEQAERIYRGVPGLAGALRDLRAPYSSGAELHVKFKVFEVSSEGVDLRAQALFQGDGPSDTSAIQQSSTWSLLFDASDRERPKLKEISISRYTENRSHRGLFFEDCTESVFAGSEVYSKHLGVHVENWLGGIQGMVFGSLLGHQGIAIGDVDGDGLEDVYVCQAGGLPNRLFIQNLDGTVRDASASAGVDFLDPSRGALLIDIDNDGDQDLLLATSAILILFENNGRAKFERRWLQPYAQLHSLAAADYDGDGDLDIYGCAYKIPDGSGVAPLPYHDANNGEPNVLLRNDSRGSHWVFTDVTLESGLDENNRRFSFAVSWEDFDNDGDLDLYVANDFGRNNLYEFENGRFRDIAGKAGVEDISAGMGVSWGDVDNDGWMDLHVSNMFSSAGNRIAYQRNFKSAADESTLSQFRRHARGNSLFSNSADGTFRDVSLEAGITMGRWAWSSKLCDLNNDTRQDILVANGLVTSDDPADL
jgi:hypothetical protein